MLNPGEMPPPEAFIEIPNLRGLRIARIGQGNGQTLEVIEAVKDLVIPMMTHPSAEKGRVLNGTLRFVTGTDVRVLSAGDTWELEANIAQGPHVVLDDDTRVVILRDGDSALG